MFYRLANMLASLPLVPALGFALIAIVATEIGNGPAVAETPDISSRRTSERMDFSNEEITDGFFKIAFHAEMQVGAPAERVRKYDEPVRIFVVSKRLSIPARTDYRIY